MRSLLILIFISFFCFAGSFEKGEIGKKDSKETNKELSTTDEIAEAFIADVVDSEEEEGEGEEGEGEGDEEGDEDDEAA